MTTLAGNKGIKYQNCFREKDRFLFGWSIGF
jgi:hypothetical protein